MQRYRESLPQLDGTLFLTDGGIETSLIFHEGLELPDFAAFHLLKSEEGRAALNRYFRKYASLATRYKTGLILETPTWRASREWAQRLGYSASDLFEANAEAVAMLDALRSVFESEVTPVVVSGCVGPRGDGYIPDNAMTADEAAEFHSAQVEGFAGSAADMVSAITMNYVEEAQGVARAAAMHEMPVAISFTVETDGRLPTGQTLESAILETDGDTDAYPAYYMINCAHPTHIDAALTQRGTWTDRVRGLRANASRRSHAELNEMPDLDDGDPVELAAQYAGLRRRLPRLNVMGGCCGTDERHVEQIAIACSPLFP